ncbi:MAG: alpha/beta fold hydrolase [Microbacterium arborescens]
MRTIRRPLASGEAFDLAYTRTGPADALPVLVFPGGPGLASVLPYQRLRSQAAKRGLGLVMMEHRGIGLSRTRLDGADLAPGDMRIIDVLDDAVAILDAEGIDRATVYGTSYGSYLAQGFGVRHPDRVAGMVLDSAMLGARVGASPTDVLRELFWEGTAQTAQQAARVRMLAQTGVIDAAEAGFPLQILHELGGIELVDDALALLERGRGLRFWRWLQSVGAEDVMTSRPFVMEFDLVGEIAFRELDFASDRDGGPLQIAGFDASAALFPAFEAEPFELVRQIRDFDWPVVVVSGDRDVRTPRTIAEQVAAAVPQSVLIEVRGHGHSALDTHPGLALDIVRTLTDAVASGVPVDRSIFGEDPEGAPGSMRTLVRGRLVAAKVVPRRLS